MATAAVADPHELLYRASPGRPALVDVPAARFLAIDGSGSPERDAFREGVEALFTLAYTAKFALKKAGGPIVKVPPLEGLYSSPAAPDEFTPAAREQLSWTLMLRVPGEMDDRVVEEARAAATRKRGRPTLDRVRIELFDEGACAQVLHIGPYAAEAPTVRLLLAFIEAQGRAPRGRHHEIYLGDPRRAKPDRLRTILRQPVV